jgi:SAM-dependent methyltransferase
MTLGAMDLHGQAMLDYLNGEQDAFCVLRRDDGIAYPPIYATQFFHPEGLPPLDRIAVEHCTGRVLDVGAGAGSHSIELRRRGLDVTSVDLSPKAVEVMRRRGVSHPMVGNVFDAHTEPFQTVLVILNIGIVGNPDGLSRFLNHLGTLLLPGGQLITDSIDPRDSADETYRRYTEAKIAKGRYLGERTLRFEYKGQASNWFEWMHIDPVTLRERTQQAGWLMTDLARDGRRYLVSITRPPKSSKLP